MFAFHTFQANCIFNYCIQCQLGGLLIRNNSVCDVFQPNELEDGKSSHRAEVYCLDGVVCDSQIYK